MAELQNYVIQSDAAGKWEELGIAMNFDEDGDKVEEIKQSSDRNDSRCRAVLRHWIKGNGDGPVTWEQLIQLLRKVNTEEVVKKIESGIVLAFAFCKFIMLLLSYKYRTWLDIS